MPSLIVADMSQERFRAIQKAVGMTYELYHCRNMEELTDLLFGIQPDLLLLDLMLPGGDSLALLRSANTAGIRPKVLVQSDFFNDHIGNALQGLDVFGVLSNPYKMEALVYKLEEIQLSLLDPNDLQTRRKRDIHSVMMALGFARNNAGYHLTVAALETICQAGHLLPMKHLYAQLIQRYGGTGTQIEKAIRDGIARAWEHRNEVIWKAYFPRSKGGKIPCPNNQLFFAQVGGRLLEQYSESLPYCEMNEM